MVNNSSKKSSLEHELEISNWSFETWFILHEFVMIFAVLVAKSGTASFADEICSNLIWFWFVLEWWNSPSFDSDLHFLILEIRPHNEIHHLNLDKSALLRAEIALFLIPIHLYSDLFVPLLASRKFTPGLLIICSHLWKFCLYFLWSDLILILIRLFIWFWFVFKCLSSPL